MITADTSALSVRKPTRCTATSALVISVHERLYTAELAMLSVHAVSSG